MVIKEIVLGLGYLGLNFTPSITALVSFLLLEKINLYKKRTFILGHSFRGFSLWSVLPIAFGSVMR